MDNIPTYQSQINKTKFDVKLENETLWLNQKQFCLFFHKLKSTKRLHVKSDYRR